MEHQDKKVRFWYNQLRVETIRHLDAYINSGKGNLAELEKELKCLHEKEQWKIINLNKLIRTLEERHVIGPNNVKALKELAEKLNLQELVCKIKEFEETSSGRFQKIKNAAGNPTGYIWDTVEEGVYTSGIRLKTVLSVPGEALMRVFQTNPEKLQHLQRFLDLGDFTLLAIPEGSAVFVLEVESKSSLEQLWKSYNDGSFKGNLRKAFNELEELKKLSKEEDIVSEVTIEQEEYNEVLSYLNNMEKKEKFQRRWIF